MCGNDPLFQQGKVGKYFAITTFAFLGLLLSLFYVSIQACYSGFMHIYIYMPINFFSYATMFYILVLFFFYCEAECLDAARKVEVIGVEWHVYNFFSYWIHLHTCIYRIGFIRIKKASSCHWFGIYLPLLFCFFFVVAVLLPVKNIFQLYLFIHFCL